MRFGFYTSLTLGSILATGVRFAAADDSDLNTPPSMLTQSWDFSDYDHDSLAQIDADYLRETNLLAQVGSESESESSSGSGSGSGSESKSESESHSESRSESGSDSDSQSSSSSDSDD